jgi:hypothetical protein
MDHDQLKQLDAKKLKTDEYHALDNILRGRGSFDDEVIVQDAIDRKLKAEGPDH